MRGGYLILDLKNVNHPPEIAVKHPGIYDLIKSTRKPIRFCNVVANDIELRDFIAKGFTISGTSYLVSAEIQGDWVITISDTDEVSFRDIS